MLSASYPVEVLVRAGSCWNRLEEPERRAGLPLHAPSQPRVAGSQLELLASKAPPV